MTGLDFTAIGDLTWQDWATVGGVGCILAAIILLVILAVGSNARPHLNLAPDGDEGEPLDPAALPVPRTRYYVTPKGGTEQEVGKPEYVDAERRNGFRNTLGFPAEPATSAFGGMYDSGRTDYYVGPTPDPDPVAEHFAGINEALWPNEGFRRDAANIAGDWTRAVEQLAADPDLTDEQRAGIERLNAEYRGQVEKHFGPGYWADVDATAERLRRWPS